MTDQLSSRPISLVPPPEDLLTRETFSDALKELKLESRRSLNALHTACKRKGKGKLVSRSTIANWFNGVIVQAGNEDAFKVVLTTLRVTEDADHQAWLAAARYLRARHALREPETPSSVRNPYRGLDVHDVEDVGMFHGRGALVGAILRSIEKLHGLGGGVVQLTGASGAGKSSALKAGVIASLRTGALDGSAGWPVLYVSTGPDPLHSLAEALAAHLGGAAEAVRIAADLTTDPVAVVRRLRCDDTDVRLVVIVDQFEQALVREPAGEDGGDALGPFLAALTALTSGIVNTAVVLGMRLDVFDAALQHPGVRALTKLPHIIVEPMTETELREVIERPARDQGVEPEPGFADLLLRDVSARNGRAGHHAGTLPLLSHALHVTWQQGGGTAMTVEAYLASGAVDGALKITAKEAFEKLTLAQQKVARRMCLSLVHVHPSGAADTRRRLTQDELFDEVGGDADLEVVLDLFVAKRLLTVDEKWVQITHEALLEAWPELRDWLDADRAERLVTQQVTSDARAWDEHGRPDSDLLVGTRLEAARNRGPQNGRELPEVARDFIAASVRHSRRRTRRLRTMVAVATVLFLGAATLAGVVLVQANTLQRQRDEAQSRTLASQVRTLRTKDVALSRQLALAAYRISPTVEARSALLDATALRPAVRMRGGEGSGIMYAAALHPGGSIAAAATETSVRFWDITRSGHPSPRPDLPSASCGKVYALTFSPSGDLLAAACGDGTIRLWNTHDPMFPTALPPLTGLGDKAKVYSVSFSLDGSMMAAAIAEPPVDKVSAGTVRLWRLSGVTLAPLGLPLQVSPGAAAKSVSFHPSNNFLAVGTRDGAVRIWDISNPEQPVDPVPAVGPTKEIGQLAFSPDGKTLAAGGADFLVHLWSTTDPRNPVAAGPPLGGADTWVNAVAFSPDSSTLAIASSDATVGVRLVELAGRRTAATMPHPAPVTSVKFSADGKTVISGSNDGTARIWPVAATALEGMDYIVSATRFSTDGTLLAVGSRDLRLFDTSTPHQLTPYGPGLPNPDGFSGTLAIAPNNRLLPEGRGRSGTVQLWDIAVPAQPNALGTPLQAATQQVETLTINSDGTLLATGSRDGTVKLWDIRVPDAPVLLSVPGEFNAYVNEVSFSPTRALLAAGSVDKTVRLWDISDPRDPKPVGSPLTPANHYVYSTTFSPDGTMLAVSLADSTVRLYDITDPASPTPIGSPLVGPENYVQSLSFTTDGTTLAAAGNDGTLWIWDVRDRYHPIVFATLTVATGALYPVHFQPRTRLLVGGSGDEKAWMWTIDVDEAAAWVCDTSGDTITREELAKYVKDRDYAPPCP